MPIRLRDINPAIFLHPMALGHSETPLAHLDVRHNADENKLVASFTNPSSASDGVTTSTSGDEELSIYHQGDTIGSDGLNIRKGGNVGIGKVKSDHKLHVAGTLMVDNKVVGQSTTLQLDTEADGNISFKLANSEKAVLNANGLGVGVTPASNEKLIVNGNVYFKGGGIIHRVGTTDSTVINSDGYVLWDQITGEPSWLDGTQSNVQVGNFGGNLGWSKVGVTGDTKPSWIDNTQSNISLSGFNNDLGASSQWTDVSSTIGSTAYTGIYYNDSDGTKARVTIGDNAVAEQALIVRDDATWQLVLKNSATGGQAWYVGANATGVLRGDGGKLLISTSKDAANTKFVFNNTGALWINEDPATTDSLITSAEKLVVKGDSYHKGITYAYNNTDQWITINNAFNSGGRTGTDWQTWWYYICQRRW